MPPQVEAGAAAVPPGAPPGGSTRTMPRLLLVLAAVFLVLRLGLAFLEKPGSEAGDEAADSGTAGATRPELVQWVGPDSAEALAARLGRPILYDFAAAWCGPCKAMKVELFADAEAARFINAAFVPARVIDRAAEDGHNPPLIDALQKKYEIRAFPTLVVAGATGEPTILQGYAGKVETLKQLHAAAAAGR